VRIQRARVAVSRGKDYLEQERLRKLRLAAARAKKFRKVREKPRKASKKMINIVLGDGLTRVSVEEKICTQEDIDEPGPSTARRKRRGKTSQRKRAKLSQPRLDRGRKVRNMSHVLSRSA
jgi:hypothetical protein